MNNNKINGKILIEDDNYILSFKVTKDISVNPPIIVKYAVSVEEEEAYSTECQITFNFKECYHSCEKCSKDISESSVEEHNCISCINNYYQSPENNNNCFSIEEKKINWYFDSINYKFGLCNNECTCSCTGPNTDDCLFCSNQIKLNFLTNNINDFSQHENNPKKIKSDTTLTEFKNQIRNDIISYVNSSNIINGTNFKAMILSSDNLNPKDQLSKGLSAVDLGNCLNDIKNYYNITKEENLIIVNIEIKIVGSDNDYNSLEFGKQTQLQIYDCSGNRLDLSVCKEDIKIIKFIGDIEEIDIESAEFYSNQGIDVFNAADKFFNDKCHPYDNPDGKDITINDRRNDIYQNVTFCQDGCRYNGINYELKAANCLCNSSFLQEDGNNMNISPEKEKISFKAISKIFIANLFSFNFEVLKCYNLAINMKILIHNIGFYCLSSMLLSQIIFVFVYMIKKLNKLKLFLKKFDNNKEKKPIRNRHINIINIINNKNYQNININKSLKSQLKGSPPPKRRLTLNRSKPINDIFWMNMDELSKKYSNKRIINQNYIDLDKIKEESFHKLNSQLQSLHKSKIDSKGNLNVAHQSDNNIPNIYNQKLLDKRNNIKIILIIIIELYLYTTLIYIKIILLF